MNLKLKFPYVKYKRWGHGPLFWRNYLGNLFYSKSNYENVMQPEAVHIKYVSL